MKSAEAPPLPVTDHITSTGNAYVKHCVRLRTSGAYREACGSVLVVGEVPLSELGGGGGGGSTPYQQHSTAVRVCFLSAGAEVPAGLYPERVLHASPEVMAKLAGLESAAGVQAVAEVQLPPDADLGAPSNTGGVVLRRLLVLDAVQDPGNLGTLLRTACALGWQAAYLLPGCCDVYNDKAMRAGRGAAFKLPLARGSWQDLQAVLTAHQLTALAAHPRSNPSGGDQQSPRYGIADGGPRLALVLGSEGQGVSPEILDACQCISIPMAGDMESLNVAVAGSILMWALGEKAAVFAKSLGAEGLTCEQPD